MKTILKTIILAAFVVAVFGAPVVQADIGDDCNRICKTKGMYFDPYGDSWYENDGKTANCACVE